MITLNVLVLSLPTRNSTMRMRIWRALKGTGCAVLRDGVYVLPTASAGTAALKRMEVEIKSAGGFAMTGELKLNTADQAVYVQRLFDRSLDYGVLVQKIRAAQKSLPRLGRHRGLTAVQRLQRSFARLSEIDFFPGQAKLQAADAIAALRQQLQEAYSQGEPRSSRKGIGRVNGARYQKRVWATRKDPWVDRLASAWLIKRFIDRDAKFVWIDHPRDRPAKAIGFDFDGAEFTHAGNRVTFEVLLTSFGLSSDQALAAIGSAVHFLDIGGIPVPDAKGLETVLRGVKEKARNDDARLNDAMRVLDLFHSAYAQATPATNEP